MMTTLLVVIYSVSWLILLVLYVNQVGRHHASLPWESDTPWYYYLAVIVAAPLVILISPYHLWKRSKEKKKLERYIREHERQEQEEARKRELAEALYKEATSEQENQCNPSFISTAQTLHKTVREKNYSSFQDILDRMYIPKGYSLCVEECAQSGLGDESKLYVTRNHLNHDYDIFTNALRFEDSCEGAWQAYLLHQLKYSLPLFWHANYIKRFYLFEANDTAHVYHFGTSCDVVLAPSDEELFPEVYGKEGRYFVTCCFWTDFGGLIRERAMIELQDGQLIECLIFSTEAILPYESSIRF